MIRWIKSLLKKYHEKEIDIHVEIEFNEYHILGAMLLVGVMLVILFR